ncbi:Adhesion G-Protein Coupled Receptor G4 [Manis pentadactyla]|nr:Adhesion G-Protein Coupled Receptor G4 [Manis pentadactyla]
MNLMKAWNPMKLVPSLIGEMLTPSCHPSRDGELKPKRESENAPSLPMRSLGKPVMTSNSVNAMPWFMDTMLPTTAISDSAGGPNEIEESLSPEPPPGFIFPCNRIAELYHINYFLNVLSAPPSCPQIVK